MNYYKRHIGDYAAKAGHLSPLEHGVYALLLDAYYNREEGPTRAEAIRWARAKSRDEIAAVDAVLAEFFDEAEGRFTQGRVEEELAAFHQRQATNRQLGAKGGQAKGKRFASDSLSEQEANAKPSHKPLAISQEEDGSPSGDQSPAAPDDPPRKPCPQERIVGLYHEVLPELRQVREWNEGRRRLLAKRWAENPDRQSLDWWRTFFGYVRKSAFLMGRTQGRDGRPFDCDLEWLVRPTNFAKVIEGKYEDSP